MVVMEWTRMSRCPCCAALPRIRSAAMVAVECSAGSTVDGPALIGATVDTHSHVHQQEPRGETPRATGTCTAVLAVDERCWDHVVRFCAVREYAVPGFGVHPWQAHEVTAGWQARLAARLVDHPGALVGEIGLCKCARNLRGPGAKARVWPLQVEAFQQQLNIAARLRRPASVHCVKAHGTLLDCLAAPPPPQL